jgi:hypothetical protein
MLALRTQLHQGLECGYAADTRRQGCYAIGNKEDCTEILQAVNGPVNTMS